MDREEHDNFSTNKTESILKPENEIDRSNGTKIEEKRNKVIDNFIEQVQRKHSLLNQNKSLLLKLVTFISRSSNKDYFSLQNYSEEENELTLKKLLDNITAIEDECHNATNKNLAILDALKEEIRLKRESLVEFKALFMQIKEKAALSSVNSETGERFSPEDVKELLTHEEKVSEKLEEYQLLAIEKRHNLNLVLGKKKNLSEGPIDFAKYEMMCIETQNNKEIIQPISEEIKSIMKKTSNIINILSHLREKLYLAQKEETKDSKTKNELEEKLNEMKDHLFEEKMKYNKMKCESKELQHKFVLLQYPGLIEDYNTVQKKNEEARKELQRLKAVYTEEMEIMKKSFKP